MGTKNLVTLAVVALVLIAGFFYLSQKSSNQTLPTVTSQTPTSTPASSSAVTTEENMVTITTNGFEPKSLTIKMGQTVNWANSDSINHTVNSDTHPTHTLFPILNIGILKPGETKSATFEKAGTYTYHDHLHPELTGTIVVN